MRINGFEQIKGFYSWVFNNQDKNIKAHHISLYIFMVNQNNRNNWIEWFKMPFDLSMTGSCISSKKTYYNCLSDLMDWGLIEYKKGVNNWKAPLVRLEVLKDTSTVPQSEPQLYLNDTSTGDTTVPQRGNNIKRITSNLQSITEIINYLNVACTSEFKDTTKNTKAHINARIKEGYSVDDFKKVIDIKVKEWSGDSKMKAFLRPDTLFGTKFESYLNQSVGSTARTGPPPTDAKPIVINPNPWL